ncbi:MAG: TonB-dependent receptor [Acidobacteria bacterium]|nr:TonB-dependent receptor [Acidobacteriota bacterium]
MKTVLRCTAILAILLLGVAPAAVAQVTTADVVGRVVDSSGGALPGATVTVTHTGTGAVRTSVTNDTGDYVFNLLPIGACTVRVELEGFSPQARSLTLSAGDRQRVDATLGVGSVTETVEVTAQAATVQSDSATVGALLPETAVQDLPLNGRNVFGLVRMVPGANEGLPSSLSTGNRPDDRRASSSVSVNGQNDIVNNNMVDGMDNNERSIGSLGVRPSVDAIAEVKVQTNMYTAETGRTAGAVVNILTKSGANDFSGSAYLFYRNAALDAYNYFANKSQPVPKNDQQQFGGSLGGPIVRNRTFFFGDYERFHQVRGITAVSTVPTARMRTGDFSQLSAVIYDPTTAVRTPFPGNVIPASRIDAVAQKFLNLYPLPTSGALVNNYTATRDRTQTADTFDIRVDHRFTNDRIAFVRYSDNRVETVAPGVFEEVNGIAAGGSAGGFAGAATSKAFNVAANYLEVFSPTLIMEVKGGWTHIDNESVPETYGQNVSQSFGLPGVNVSDITSGLPNFTVAGYTTLGDATFIPILIKNNNWQVNATVTNTRGNHNLKAGAAVIRRSFLVYQSNNPAGTFGFTAAPTNNGAGAGGDAVASFLLGYPASVTRAVLIAEPTLQSWEPSVFVQDDWRVNDKLTLNLGLRYDVFTPLTEPDGEIANIDLKTMQFLVPGQNGVGKTAGIKTDWSNISPRAGFAYTLRPGTVFRGGYGLSYWPTSVGSGAFLRNAPFTYTYSATNAAASGGVPDVFLRTGLPSIPSTVPTTLSGSIAPVDLNLKHSRIQQYNVMLEKELWGSSVTIGYVGSRASNLWNTIGNWNNAPPGAGAVQQRRAYYSVAPNLQGIAFHTSGGKQTYNALQASFARRSRNGLTMSLNYTLAKGMSNVTQPGGGGAAQAYAVVPSQWETTEWSASDIDIRHRYALSMNYELPFGRNASGAARQIIGGWQVNAVAFWQSGLPFTVVNATPRSNTGVGANGDRPNQTCSGELDNPSVAKWFDTSCFVGQTLNTLGNSGRNNLHGPPTRRIDMSVFKDFFIGTNKLQFRAEVYNLTNTASFGVPNGSLGNAAFGTITTTANNPPRQFQFAAKFLF